VLNHPYETWDHLQVLLAEMQVLFQNFLSLLNKEERLLLVMDRQGVADITEKKEQVLDGMHRYEQQVMGVMPQLAGSDHQGHLGGWLRNVPHRHAVSANTIFHELIGLIQKIQEQGKKNESLIRRTQHVVREAINLIYTGLGTGPVYQGSGALQFSSVPSSVNLHG
jgi:flagellar biosynthesis/type III secretory pathway chaperone